MRFLRNATKTSNNGAPVEEKHQQPRMPAWKCLVVDDEPDIIHITRITLQEFQLAGRGIEILQANGSAAARDLFARHQDIAVAIIDVVMEVEDAGLRLVEFVRNDLGNTMTRLLIRTGQPGLAPERFVIDNYDIDGYYDKTELTSQRLYTAVRAAIRSYRQLHAIDLNRVGLKHVLAATQDIYHARPASMEEFLQGVLTQIIGLFLLGDSAIIATVEAAILTLEGEDLQLRAGTGEFAQAPDPRAKHIVETCRQVILEQAPKRNLLEDSLIVPLHLENRPIGFIYLEHTSQLTDEDIQLLQIMANQCATALENTRLEMELAASYDKLIEIVGIIAEFRDRTTGEHIQRIANLTVDVALALGIPKEQAQTWGRAALLHDVGKVAIPDRILNKPGGLTLEEREVIRTHATIGGEILSHDAHLELARTIAVSHHEHWDGSGYPHRLRGEEIPLPARIVSVVDVFDALTNRRPYKKAWSKADALDHLQKQRGRQFDPRIVDVFTNIQGQQDEPSETPVQWMPSD